MTFADINKNKKDTSHKIATKAVEEAVNLLLDNGFTGVDIVTFVTANQNAIAGTIATEYNNRTRKPKQKRN